MSDLNNFQLNTSDNEERDPELPHQKENFGFHKIKHIIHKNSEARSKSAPLEEFESEDDSDFLSSYNYYIYYNSQVPRDSHLPKPTYVLGDIKETKAKDEEDQPEIQNEVINKPIETIQNMMNNLNLEYCNSNDKNKLLNDIPNTNMDFQNQLGNTGNNNINNNNAFNQNENINNNNNAFGDFFKINQNLGNSNGNNNNIKNPLDMIDDNFNLNNFINENNMNLNNKLNFDNNDFNSLGNISINDNKIDLNKLNKISFNNINNENNLFKKNYEMNNFDPYNKSSSMNNKLNNNMNMQFNNNHLFRNDNMNSMNNTNNIK